MFNLIRRISYGVIPRPDRPWEEDPTSNAPNTKRKRRMSTSERDAADDAEEQAAAKRARGDSATPSLVDAALVPLPQADAAELKEVTQGVDEVHIDETAAHDEAAPLAPESVPLPEDSAEDLDVASSPIVPDAEAATVEEEEQEGQAVDATADGPAANATVDDASDVASSSAEDAAPEAKKEQQEPVPAAAAVDAAEPSPAVPETTAEV